MDCAVIVTPYNHISFKRRKNTWYSIANGNWTDGNIWMSNSHRRYAFPQTGDNVFINHTVTCNTTASLNNLYVSGILNFDSTARTVTLSGDIQATGGINMSNAAHNLVLNGVNNYIATFTSGTASTVTYARIGDQYIMDLSYRNLTTSGNGTGFKYMTSSLTVTGNLTIGTPTELGIYNLTVNGSTSTTANVGYSTISKTGSGTVLFIGAVNLGPFSSGIDFSVGNPTVECRGGITSVNQTIVNNFKSGTGQWTFSTNNQSISTNSGGTSILQFDGPVLISGAITLTFVPSGSALNQTVKFNSSVSRDNVAGALANKLNISFGNSTAADGILTTGGFDWTTFSGSTLIYGFDGNYTLPYTTYQGLTINGTGTKTVIGNTILSNSLNVYGATSSSNTTLELSTFDFTVTGTTTIGGAGNLKGLLNKTGAGNVIFIGQVIFPVSVGSLNFSSGNPTVEMRGGLAMTNASLGSLSTGLGTWTFSTNNQNISSTISGAAFFQIDAPLLISGAITLTATAASGTLSITFTNTINGNNAASTFDSRQTVNYQAAQQPMLAGVLQTNAAANTFNYNRPGDQDITGGTYRTLTLSGSGVKTLQGNVVAATTYTLTPPATLNTNGYTRT